MKSFLRLFVVAISLLFAAGRLQAQSPAHEAGYLYLSPVPNASYVSAQTRFILVRFENIAPLEVTNLASCVKVTGAASGPHAGSTHVATDGRTVIFTMSTDFSTNELVTVTLNPGIALPDPGNRNLQPYEYQFLVMGLMPGTLTTAGSSPLVPLSGVSPPAGGGSSSDGSDGGTGPVTANALVTAAIAPNGVSVPKGFPAVVISVNNHPSPGYLFMETGVSSDPKFTMMVDNNGLPIWYQSGRLGDMKIQKNGMITWSVGDGEGFVAYDNDFNYLKTFYTVNGFLTEGHDFEIRADGSYLMLGYRYNPVDLSKYIPGANPNASIRENVIQEFTAAGELIFQWRAWDYYDIRDEGGNTDFPHMNALDFDDDGHILVSARHLSEVTKINRDTGDILWRLSGAHSSFNFVNDPFNGTSYQHDISGLGHGHYMVFDNGVTHSPQVSRAVEYELDLTNLTATVVWQFRDTPDKYAYWLGNAQRLPTGNTLINFVRPQYPKAIEVDTNGVKRFELSLVPSSDAYRSFRFPWTGAAAAPYLMLEAQPDNVALLFNKFGDTNVAYFRIYGGTTPAPTNLLDTATTTLKHLTNVANGVTNYFRVTAVSKEDVESEYSNEEKLLVNISLPGQNMVLNGAFAAGAAPWIWQVTLPAAALFQTAGGLGHFAIASGGTYLTDVQLSETGMKLTQGKEYTFAFDAWSVAPRAFEAKVEATSPAGANYSGIQPLVITPVTNHFSFTFTMLNPSDNNARVVFNAGALPHDVYLANVVLRERVYAAGDFDWDGCVGFKDLKVLTGEWQKSASPLAADLNKDGKVNFADFVRFAQSWTGGGTCP